MGDITIRRPDGTYDYGAIRDMNAASTTYSNMVMSMSNNSHEWYGLVSTYKNEVLPNKLTLTGGIDIRYYVATTIIKSSTSMGANIISTTAAVAAPT